VKPVMKVSSTDDVTLSGSFAYTYRSWMLQWTMRRI